MKKEEKEFLSKSSEFIKKYFFLFAGILLILISFLIIKGFIIALISAFILAYLTRPLQRKLSKHLNKKIAALLCLLIIILAILIPVFLLIFSLIKQVNTALYFAPAIKLNIALIDSYLPTVKTDILSIILGFLKSTIVEIPSILISTAIMIVSTYYLIAEWDQLIKKIEIITPFKDKMRIRKEVSSLTDNIVYGYVFIAIIEFLIGVIGFYLSGSKLYLILPVLMAILAFIPGIGPGAIWIPTTLYYFLIGNYFSAIGILITGLIISIVIETILLPKIIGDKSKIHPLVFLLGVIGGVPIFGIFGFIIGPLVLVYTIKLVEESLNN